MICILCVYPDPEIQIIITINVYAFTKCVYRVEKSAYKQKKNKKMTKRKNERKRGNTGKKNNRQGSTQTKHTSVERWKRRRKKRRKKRRNLFEFENFEMFVLRNINIYITLYISFLRTFWVLAKWINAIIEEYILLLHIIVTLKLFIYFEKRGSEKGKKHLKEYFWFLHCAWLNIERPNKGGNERFHRARQWNAMSKAQRENRAKNYFII